MYKLFLTAVAFLACAASIDAQDSTIYEIVKSNDNFATLATALELTDLDEVLDCTNPFWCRYTVFAPTDKAFSKLPEGLLGKLITEDWKAHLTRILLYHVAYGFYKAADIEDGGKVSTLAGEYVNTTIEDDGTVKINTATVSSADVEASNGWVHVIDQVLIPSFMTKDIITTAKETGIFDTLLVAVEAAGLTDTLKGEGPFTLFAPTDSAFDKLGEGAVEALLQDKQTLTDILKYHVIDNSIVLSSELEDGTSLTTIQGEDIEVNTFGFWIFQFPYLNKDVYFSGTDILTSNGVIHIISDVLIPGSATPPEPTIAEIVGADPILTTLAAALNAAMLLDTFKEEGPFTLFAPSDAAFAELGDETITALLADPVELAKILKYHVVSGEVKRKDLEDGAVKTLNGADIIVDKGFFQVYINEDTRVKEFDIDGSNGVVHIINKVLLPPADCLSVAESKGLTSFVDAVDAAGLQSELSDPKSSLTIFAPNNSAFKAIEGVDLDTTTLATVLTYHVLPTTAASGDLSDDLSLPTLEGSSIEVTFKYILFIFFSGAFLDDNAKIVETDIVCAGGIIHIIDEVL
eukprot:CAMPEP_0119007422 /NCGR_PEP_ID=MMETSP1176-20130426/2997_1 /TAXON_ID=265551 /ORGANISM="Synedropsis recta cf, Strain CCMP1620" /LENGTH=575 /DNA_ID=CAMNT_0006959565 /DNA_START=98 /DNA_END=1822 /DNA_ORIENTATION=+